MSKKSYRVGQFFGVLLGAVAGTLIVNVMFGRRVQPPPPQIYQETQPQQIGVYEQALSMPAKKVE